MKTFFCSIVSMFASVLLFAQSSSVQYVSFFPPAHIVHSEVSLTQNDNSFDYLYELNKQTNSEDYHSKSGGLILGAAKKAEINIKEVSLVGTVNTTDRFGAIRNFTVENLIEVSGKGRIGILNIGTPCANSDVSQCTNAFLSANAISLPLVSKYNNDVNTIVKSSGVSDLKGLLLDNGENTNTFNKFLTSMTTGDKLKWVHLRLKGTSYCKRYLVKYTGATAPSDNCNQPPDAHNY